MYCLPFIYLIPLSNKLKLVLTLVNIARIVLFQLMSKLQRKICRLLLFIFFRGILFACLMFSLQQGCIFTRKVDWYLLQIKGFFLCPKYRPQGFSVSVSMYMCSSWIEAIKTTSFSQGCQFICGTNPAWINTCCFDLALSTLMSLIPVSLYVQNRIEIEISFIVPHWGNSSVPVEE